MIFTCKENIRCIFFFVLECTKIEPCDKRMECDPNIMYINTSNTYAMYKIKRHFTDSVCM